MTDKQYLSADHAFKLINEAEKGSAVQLAQLLIAQLSDDDKFYVGAELEQMAIAIDDVENKA